MRQIIEIREEGKTMKIGVLISTFTALIFLLFTSGCQPTISSQIADSIGSSCASTVKCEVRLADFTDFEWDRVYYFDKAVEDHQMDNILGQDISFYSFWALSHKMVFMKGNKIVHSEKIPAGKEDFAEGELTFGLRQGKYGVFEKNAIFDVKKKQMTDVRAYDLKCLNCCSNLPENKTQADCG